MTYDFVGTYTPLNLVRRMLDADGRHDGPHPRHAACLIRRRRDWSWLALVLLMMGCQQATPPPTQNAPSFTFASLVEYPYVNTADLLAALTVEDQVVFVEFSMPVGCARCDLMRDQITQLVEERHAQVVYRRVNVRNEPQLASKLGITMCPSYLAFRNGKEILRTAFPASADLIAGELDRALARPSDS